MSRADRTRLLELLPIVGLITLAGVTVSTQGAARPPDDLPSPYETVKNWGTLPPGRAWGSTGAVNIDRDGASVWAIERCGSFSWQSTGRVSCAGSDLAPVLKFDPSGKVEKSFGGGLFIFPHGIHVDREGNVWVTDARAATAAELKQFPDAKGKGHTVVKFSPDGKLLLTLGTPGVRGDPPEYLNEPCDVITTPTGDILIAEGHSGQNTTPAPTTISRISQFSKDGKFVRSWGAWALARASSRRLTPSATMLAAGCWSRTAGTTGFKSSSRTARSSSRGASSGDRAMFTSMPMTSSTSRTRNRVSGTAPIGGGESVSAARPTGW
jgi:hypothetical protein